LVARRRNRHVVDPRVSSLAGAQAREPSNATPSRRTRPCLRQIHLFGAVLVIGVDEQTGDVVAAPRQLLDFAERTMDSVESAVA
jgi:hypothetical protein